MSTGTPSSYIRFIRPRDPVSGLVLPREENVFVSTTESHHPTSPLKSFSIYLIPYFVSREGLKEQTFRKDGMLDSSIGPLGNTIFVQTKKVENTL